MTQEQPQPFDRLEEFRKEFEVHKTNAQEGLKFIQDELRRNQKQNALNDILKEADGVLAAASERPLSPEELDNWEGLMNSLVAF